MNRQRQIMDYRLYAIGGGPGPRDPVAALEAALRGGATLAQWRPKHLPARQQYETAVQALSVARRLGVPLIVDDRVDIALAIGADGVHIGQQDLPAAVVRRLLGPGLILGVSASTPAEAKEAEEAGADYLGVGPVFPTFSKADAGEAIGLEGLRAVIEATRLPVVAIGGITRENAPLVLAAGAAGVAVISALFGQPDVAEAATRLRKAIDEAMAGQTRG